VTATPGVPSTPAGAPVRNRVRPVDLVRWGLLAAVAVVAAGLTLLGTRTASINDLRAAVAAGTVSEIRVAGALPEGLGATGGSGYATVHLAWDEGGRARSATVLQVSDPTVSATDAVSAEERVVGDVDRYVRGMPGGESVRIVRDDRGLPRGGTLFGVEVPTWVVSAAVVAWLGTLVLLLAGPEPFVATRWAWFWILVSPFAVVGVPLFLAIGGGGRSFAGEPSRSRRMTGRWTFLVVAVSASVVWPAL
jgi:hypothetical protein